MIQIGLDLHTTRFATVHLTTAQCYDRAEKSNLQPVFALRAITVFPCSYDENWVPRQSVYVYDSCSVLGHYLYPSQLISNKQSQRRNLGLLNDLITAAKKVIKVDVIHLTTASLSNRSYSPKCGCRLRTTYTRGPQPSGHSPLLVGEWKCAYPLARAACVCAKLHLCKQWVLARLKLHLHNEACANGAVHTCTCACHSHSTILSPPSCPPSQKGWEPLWPTVFTIL